MDDKMICLWREAFKIFHFLSSKNISHCRHQNIFNMRNAHFKIEVNFQKCSNQVRSLISNCLQLVSLQICQQINCVLQKLKMLTQNWH